MAGVPSLVAKSETGYELSVVDLDPLRASICAVGEFDLAAHRELTSVLRQQEVARRRYVRLDLSNVTFLDCSCLEVLVESHRRLLERHGMLVLSGVDGRVARILKITGLDNTLFVVPADQDLSIAIARAAGRGTTPQQEPACVASFATPAVVGGQPPANDRKAVS